MYKDGQALSEAQSTGSKMLCCDARLGVSLDFALTIRTCTWIQKVMDTFLVYLIITVSKRFRHSFTKSNKNESCTHKSTVNGNVSLQEVQC